MDNLNKINNKSETDATQNKDRKEATKHLSKISRIETDEWG